MNRFRLIVIGMSFLILGHIAEAQVGSNWTEVTSAASWSPRYGFGSVAFNGRMWVLGGKTNGTVNGNVNDVWSSPDGTNWTQVTSSAPWSARFAFPTVVFNGRMWVLGGDGSSYYNDVWSSPDGTNWTQVTSSAPWSPRIYQKVIVLNGQMWLLGGVVNGNTYFNDVWSSPDGTNWTQVTSSAPWSARSPSGAVVLNGEMWVLGGVEGFNNGSSLFNDVWSSPDGTNWTQVTAAAPWSARTASGSVAFNGQMWLLGGYNGLRFNDVWSSSDGTNWTEVTSSAPWSDREESGSVAFNGQMWVLGGLGNGPIYNDVWSTTPAPFQITAIGLQSKNVLLTWNTFAGTINLVQAATGAADGSYSNNFLTISPPIFIPTNPPGLVTTNYPDVGGATNVPARYYRIFMTTPLLAGFTAAPTNGIAPLSVTFTDESTGTITNWFWDFGDGATTNVSSAGITHTYTAAGTDTVQLIVSGPAGSSTNIQANLIVVLQPADNAADPAYGGGWTNGSNGGAGLGPWVLTGSGVIASSSNGYFIGSSTNNAFGTSPGIDVDGKSWGIYANDNNVTAAYRGFSNSVPVSGGFKIDMDNGFIDTGNADGFVLRTGNVTGSYTNYNTGARFEFLYIGGDSSNSYKVVDNAGIYNIGVPFTGTGLHLVFTLNTADTYTLLVIDNASGDTNAVVTGTLSGSPGSTIDSLAVYNRNAGSGPAYDAFFNSIEIFGP